jgi:hypothetical protein
VGTTAFYGAAFQATKSAEAHTAFGDSALVQTKLAGDAGLCPGRFLSGYNLRRSLLQWRSLDRFCRNDGKSPCERGRIQRILFHCRS